MSKSFDDLKAEAEQEQENERLQAGDPCPEEHCDLELREHLFPFEPRFQTRPATPERETYCLHDGIISRA